ncbi:MAG TPA: VWA domain-containing protein [Spirochaetota bacterium]|nr:VWA domain-containing protein [Spirochaetota bacterium]HPI90792.1 VWA domain-containing protein [Spirochaetota bacterium]HPR48942.1 VWA domain-containing protein [Spirochaetota bacterium]
MKRQNREVNIFNLSMLDVMTGALGAVMVVMIVLLTQKIGIESMTCQDVKSELIETSRELSTTTQELALTRKELNNYKQANPEAVEKISAITRIIDSTAEKFTGTIKKISQISEELFKTPEESDELIAFKIPHKIVMLIDLSGSMAAANNKYNEDRLSQIKAAVKMFIAAMDERYWLDIVFFPAFSENINREVYPGFAITPSPDRQCTGYELRDEAYDNPKLTCYKYGYFEGKLANVLSEKEKIGFYKKIACLQPYHDTPTEAALKFVLTGDRYKDAEGIILFSDGQPDSLRKKIMSKDALLKSIRDENSSKKKIFTVGVGTEFRNREDSEAVDFLKKLAQQNEGFYIGF